MSARQPGNTLTEARGPQKVTRRQHDFVSTQFIQQRVQTISDVGGLGLFHCGGGTDGSSSNAMTGGPTAANIRSAKIRSPSPSSTVPPRCLRHECSFRL